MLFAGICLPEAQAFRHPAPGARVSNRFFGGDEPPMSVVLSIRIDPLARRHAGGFRD